MNNLTFLISILNTLIDVMITFFLVYFTLIGFAGIVGIFKRKKNISAKVQRSFKFIICAHNEELVIEDCLASIQEQDYDINKISILVVCDNSTDGTYIALQKFENIVNYRILERVSEQKGKQYALDSALNSLKNEGDKTDYYVFIDADNVLGSNYLTNLNSEIESINCLAIQGNVQVKNPNDNLLTNTIRYLVVTSAGMYFYGRKLLGLSTTLYGNGFAISRELLTKIPFNVESVTEDLEYSVILLLNNIKIGYCHEAITYDEKPTNARVSTKQRERWMRGHFWVTKNYSLKIVQSIFKPGFKMLFSKIDYLIYLLFPFRTLILIYLLYNPVSTMIFGPDANSIFFKFEYNILFVLLVSLVYNLMEIVIAIRSGMNLWQITKAILYNQVHSIDWFIATQLGFFKSSDQRWGDSKTHHFRKINK
ncbi:MAG: glycosyltransferase family 2 protein [Patescibacteria group bacterium]